MIGPKESAARGEWIALPGLREDAGAICVAEFCEGFNLEVEAAIVEDFEFCRRPSQGVEGIHDSGVTGSEWAREAEKGGCERDGDASSIGKEGVEGGEEPDRRV